MNFSTFLETQLLNTMFRSAAAYKPPAIYAALFTGDPTDAAGGPEVSTTGTGYTRVQITQADASWTAPAGDPSGGSISRNTTPISFPTPTGDWGRVTHVALFDAASAGNKLVWGQIVPKNINNGDPAPTFPANSISWRLD
ncbi:MAG: hypothetical protein FWF31_11365 [Desulfobulbus sp.]|nr:hypothetical protein [Desulfobulbus sp.]